MNQNERNFIYNQMMLQISENKDKFLDTDEGVRKIKVIAKLFKDSGIESKGEINLTTNYTILYQFYNDRKKRTDVSIIRTPNMNFFEKKNTPKVKNDNDEVPELVKI